MTDIADPLSLIAKAQAGFMELIAGVRPELHRYCARMMGSVIDGEDVVQDTLAKASFALGQMLEVPPLRPWLFKIAHNTAMDHLRRYERRHVDLVADVPEPAEAATDEVDPALVEAALVVFVSLPPIQRSALILKDVLGHSLDQTAEAMGTTVAAVKAALVRARANVDTRRSTERANPSVPEMAALQRYADLFNARDWDGLRALLAAECRLDLVARAHRRGAAVGSYFSRYAERAEAEGLRLEAGILEGTAALAAYSPDSAAPTYFILLTWTDEGRVASIRDFRYVPYIAERACFVSWSF